MPVEVVAILQKVEHPLGWEISCKEIEQGWSSKLLIADDYSAPSEVSKKIFYFSHSYLISTPNYLLL